MKIEIIKTIENPFLKNAWKDLEKKYNIFPQHTYHWCSTWWKYLSNKRKIYIVMCISEDGSVAGIMPLCIESRMGIKILRNFPINYGDFYQPIISKEFDEHQVLDCVYEHLNTFQMWDAVIFQPVNNHSNLYRFLNEKKLPSLCLIGNILADIQVATWDDYMLQLSYNRRKMTRKMMRKLENEFSITLEIITDKEKYLQHFDTIHAIQARRWENDNRPKRSKEYIACTKEINAGLFDKGKMVLYLLRANEEILSYRIGIIHEETYYDWNTNYDLKWEKYSPGLIGVAYVIQDLINRKVKYLDFMAGIYNYKVSYSPLAETRYNYMFISSNSNIRGLLLKKYYLELRPKIKKIYAEIKEIIRKRRNNSQAKSSD